ncbi:MAG: response regulator transcription factor [Thermaerobacter sp.]|nr:response regulator transcription factor [Thermaerobacter sp.]
MVPTTLLIEDDQRIARLLILEIERAGWRVIWHKTGGDALAAMTSAAYDLVILDLMLPDLDGLVLCKSLRTMSDVPILILTARDGVPDRVLGLDAGADDYLVKPFAASELLARMRALIRRRLTARPGDEDWLTAGTLQLSARRHEVRIADNPIALTRREFTLLQYFLENVGITLTRDMILDRVWGWGYSGSASIVDVYVGYLRQKLNSPMSHCQLTTIRGVGFVLKEEPSP